MQDPTPSTQLQPGPLLATGPSAGPATLGPGFSRSPSGGLLFGGVPYAASPAIGPVGLVGGGAGVADDRAPAGPLVPVPALPAFLPEFPASGVGWPGLPVVEVPTPPLRPPGGVGEVPEPASWLMLGSGLVAVGLVARWRRRG